MPHRHPFDTHALGLLIFASLVPSMSSAQEAEPITGLRFNGFATLGVTHTDMSRAWGFRRDASQPSNSGGTRADTDSRLGLQANYALDEKIEFVGQVQLKRRVSSSRPEESLEWAFASYRVTPDLTIRAGRTSPDIFLLSDYRSVGFAYPTVRPNVETYGLLPIFSIDGADLAYKWSVDEVAWRAKAFAGRGRTRTPGADGRADVDFRLTSLIGVTVSRESEGFLLRATLVSARGGLGESGGSGALRAGLASVQNLPAPTVAEEARRLSAGLDPETTNVTYVALGSSYDAGGWIACAEIGRISSRASYAAATTAYATVGRRFGAVTVFGELGAARSYRHPPPSPSWEAVLAPIVGPVAAAQAQALGAAAALSVDTGVDQRSVSLGARWELHPQMALKFQWDHFETAADGSVLWQRRTYDAGHGNVLTAALDFVF